MTADTRQLILDTAVRLFEEKGYAGTTMRAIATEAGLSPSNAFWVAHLGVTLFWTVDTSRSQQRTHTLVERSVGLLGSVVRLARLHGSSGLVDHVAGVLDVVVPERRRS